LFTGTSKERSAGAIEIFKFEILSLKSQAVEISKRKHHEGSGISKKDL
jgi:hypothetical protein